jgi:Ca2+:H+ antiporter
MSVSTRFFGLPLWSLLLPPLAAAGLAVAWGRPLHPALISAIGIVLIGAVMVAVHHAEVIAHRVGEPFGTLILALAVTIIEVALIVSMKLSGGEAAGALARDTVFAALMIVCNGVVGLCLLVGGLRHRVMVFRVDGTSPALSVLAALATLTLVLPAYTTSTPGPTFSPAQLAFAGISSLALYAVFVFVQTVRHREYFLPVEVDPDAGPDSETAPPHASPPSRRTAWISLGLLLVCLVAVVGLAKTLSPAIQSAVQAAGAPPAVVGIAIALLVLLPETFAAVRAARLNRMQTSLNLALGSVLATIGLTIPVVAALSILVDLPLLLGLPAKETVLLVVTLLVSTTTLASGRATVLQGAVHLVLFAAFLFVVARAHHGARGDVGKAHRLTLALPAREDVGVHVAQHRQVAVRGLQVLADGQHLDVVGAHVAHHFEHFLVGLAEADHDAALGRNTGVHRPEFLEQFERMQVLGTRPGLLVKARRGFKVVVHHVGQRLAENFERHVDAAPEVGHQHFDLGGGRGLANRPDAVDEVLGAAVAQVVTVDAGDHHVLESHIGHRLGEVARLVDVERQGLAVADVAERAAPGADVAHDHEGRRALAEALADVGTGGFFADGVQLLLAQDLLDLAEAAALVAGLDANPVRLAQTLGGHDLDRDAGGLLFALELDAPHGVGLFFIHRSFSKLRRHKVRLSTVVLAPDTARTRKHLGQQALDSIAQEFMDAEYGSVETRRQATGIIKIPAFADEL